MAEEENPPAEAAAATPAPEPTAAASTPDAAAAAPAAAAPKPPRAPKGAKKDALAPEAEKPKENLSLDPNDVEKPKIVKAKGSKNVIVGIAHIFSTFNNTSVSRSPISTATPLVGPAPAR